MNGLQLRPVAISGANGPRSSMFSGGINDLFGVRLGKGGSMLGQTTDRGWYERAKSEIAKFDDLSARTKKISNKSVREQLWATHVGDASDRSSGAYRRDSVAQNAAEAESYTPVNYLIYASGTTARERVDKLSDINHDFRVAVEEAERTWGVLPEPQIIERIVEVPAAGVSGSTILTVAVVGGIGVIALALLGVFD